MKPHIFLFIMTCIFFIKLVLLFNNDLINLIKNNIITQGLIYFIIIIIPLFLLKYAIITNNKDGYEIPHIMFNILILLFIVYSNDIRILYLIIFLLVVALLSRVYYKGCVFNIASDYKKKYLPIPLKNINDFLNWDIVYLLLLIVAIYKYNINDNKLYWI